MSILGYIFPPLLGGIIALSTNWLAIKMLFRPHKAKYVFGIQLPFTPGLIPKERSRLAKKLAEAVSTRLLTPEVLAAELSNLSTWPLPDMTVGQALLSVGIDIENAAPVAKHLKIMSDKFLLNALGAASNITELNPGLDEKLAALTYKIIDDNLGTITKIFISKEKIYTSIKNNVFAYLSNPENYEQIQQHLHNCIDSLLSGVSPITKNFFEINIKESLENFLYEQKHVVAHVLEIVASYIAKNISIQSMIENKLDAFNVAEAEKLILSVAGRELRMIVWLGGILGFVIGTIMLLI